MCLSTLGFQDSDEGECGSPSPLDIVIKKMNCAA